MYPPSCVVDVLLVREWKAFGCECAVRGGLECEDYLEVSRSPPFVTVVVTVSRRAPVIVVGQDGGWGIQEGVRMMVVSTAVRPGVWMASLFAYAAGITGTLANLFLIVFFAFQFSSLGGGASFGSANDLVGSLATAVMVPVVLALSAWLPDRRLRWISRILGLSALTVLAVGGPLLVLGVLSFEVQAPIAVAAWMVLCLWLLLVNRWSRLSAILVPWVARLGEFLGAGTVAGIVIVGLGVLLPGASWAQPVVFGIGGVLALVGMLGIPVWFLILGRHLGRS